MRLMIALLAGTLVIASPIALAHAQEEDERQMLVIPLSGKLRGKLRKAPRRLNKAVSKAAGSSGAALINARVGRSEIAAITGCRADSSTCYDEIATTIGVQEIVFGSVRPGSGKTTMVVKLTWVRVGHPAKTTEVELTSRRPRAAAKELQTKLEPFFAKPTVKPPPKPIAKPPPPPPPKKKAPGFSLSRVKGRTWGIVGGGVAATVLGFVFRARASSRQDEIDGAPTDSLADLRRLEDLESSAKRNKLFGNSFLVVGLAATAVGGVLIWREGSRTPADQPRVTITPVLQRNGGGFAVSIPWDL